MASHVLLWQRSHAAPFLSSSDEVATNTTGGDTMLVLLAIICVVFFAYALTFNKIGDAVPQKVSDAFQKSTPSQSDHT
jgi:hypothetical protein